VYSIDAYTQACESSLERERESGIEVVDIHQTFESFSKVERPEKSHTKIISRKILICPIIGFKYDLF
jgi:hypothetical protein